MSKSDNADVCFMIRYNRLKTVSSPGLKAALVHKTSVKIIEGWLATGLCTDATSVSVHTKTSDRVSKCVGLRCSSNTPDVVVASFLNDERHDPWGQALRRHCPGRGEKRPWVSCSRTRRLNSVPPTPPPPLGLGLNRGRTLLVPEMAVGPPK